MAPWSSELVPGQVGGQILRFYGLFGEEQMASGGSWDGSDEGLVRSDELGVAP